MSRNTVGYDQPSTFVCNPPSPSTSSAAAAAATTTYPSDDQAILFPVSAGFEINHYTEALVSKIAPKDILLVSQKPSEHICYYLSSAELARRFVEEEFTIRNGRAEYKVQPQLLSKLRTVTISNVSPEIPNSFIVENVLRSFGVSPKSEITPVKSELSEADSEQISSFRRQFYMDSQDVDKLPSCVVVEIVKREEVINFTVET